MFWALVNKAAAPVNGDPIVQAYPVVTAFAGGADPTAVVYLPLQLSRSELGDTGRRFSVGIAVCLSTTDDLVTLPAAGNNLRVNAMSS
jgi:hypothetical protein